MASELKTLPRAEMRVKLTLQPFDFSANTLDFAGGNVGWIGEATERGDFSLEATSPLFPDPVSARWRKRPLPAPAPHSHASRLLFARTCSNRICCLVSDT